jgi:hypothetical protein
MKDPGSEDDKLRQLYDTVSEARRTVGQEPVPFDRFADLIRTQMSSLQQKGHDDVAFRVAIKDGKVAFSAKAVKPKSTEGSGGKGEVDEREK